jgi:nucleotidyltransferase substrate binding protein (TIGR01987 family)
MRPSKRENFEKALAALQKSISMPIEDERDLAGIIKSFEIVYELSWILLKVTLRESGIEAAGPRDVIKAAWQSGFLEVETESVWLSMIKDRNLTVHTYDEKFARMMVERIMEQYTPAFQTLSQFLEKDR